MKTNNLTVSVPYAGCDKNCPYCVSKMTGYMKPDFSLMMNRVDKVINLAKIADATSVLFTGKGEVMLNYPMLFKLIEKFSSHFFCEVQTNGKFLVENPTYILILAEKGVSTLAISIDTFNFENLKVICEMAKTAGMLLRATVNLWDKTQEHGPAVWIEKLKSFGFDQVSFRKLSIPQNPCSTIEASDTINWIQLHAKVDERWFVALDTLISNGRKIRTLGFGPEVYSIHGVAVTYFPYCIQENNNGDDVRSLIFQENGHLYDSWDDPASVLF
jgi:organic radical activating enzyme